MKSRMTMKKIYSWQNENNMLFNTKKFELLRYGGKIELQSSSYPKPEGTDDIPVKVALRDL